MPHPAFFMAAYDATTSLRPFQFILFTIHESPERQETRAFRSGSEQRQHVFPCGFDRQGFR